MNKITLQIDPDPSNIPLLIQCVGEFFKHHNVEQGVQYQLITCMMESMNNILLHGVAATYDQQIYIVCKVYSYCVVLEIIDRGGKMCLPSLQTVPWSAENGRGWWIIRNWIDHVIYRRRRGQNVLVLQKYFDQVC